MPICLFVGAKMDIINKILESTREAAVLLDSACGPIAKIALNEISERKEKVARQTRPEFYEENDSNSSLWGNNNLGNTETLDGSDHEEEFMNSLFGEIWWEEVFESLSNGFFEKQIGSLISYHQRGVRGWADSDVWKLDFYLTRTLGEQLLFLSEHGTGWPNSDKYETYESWVSDLKMYGNDLLNYSSKNNWFDGEGNLMEYKDIVAYNNKLEKKAKQALRWVATNLTNLWN
jgi:hypothetical protein